MAKQRTDSRAQRPTPRRAPLFDAAEGGSGTGSDPPGGIGEVVVPLHEAAQARYLNYALSVITARALPDVRDGLKPVQRRILYTMWRQRLTADAKPRKCAKVVGDVMGNYHPHGDTAIYDTLVRMAQPFSLRYPLVDGAGNFGSLDGDAAAAMRYTECRLAPISAELLAEIDQETVPFRDAYDGSRTEPVVLPARLPNLLVNGASGIAVGMATNIPPHNLGEITDALLLLLENPDLDSAQLARRVRGPDFPTGGRITNTTDELVEIYCTGSGTIRVRATWESGPVRRSSRTLHVTSVPYTVNKAQVVERIGEIVASRALPALLDVKDVSTGDVRIALELRADADPRLVMAYLFKHTPLQSTFPVNMTCLVPTGEAGVGRPERLGLHELLSHFLSFRLDVVTRRLEHELAGLRARIHILEGFERAFDMLDAIIALIRSSDGKADAAAKIVQLFPLDAEQTDAILELKVYRLARLEIRRIREELAAKRSRAAEIGELLRDEDRRWGIVRDEIDEVRRSHGDPDTSPRRTVIDSTVEDVAFSADDFIVDEDAIVLVSADGWVKRQKEVRDLSATRLREGDTLLAAVAGSTRSTAVFFSSFGVAYSCRLIDVPASTGYGEPIQRLFKLRDGERIVAAIGLDPRVTPSIESPAEDQEPPTHALAVTSDGNGLRFSLEPLVEPSTRAGRRFARPAGDAGVVGVAPVNGSETLIAATRQGRAMLCPVREINFLSGAGRGVRIVKLDASDDGVVGFVASRGDRDLLSVETSRGAVQTISTAKYTVTGRGGRGRVLLQRGRFAAVVPRPVTLPDLEPRNGKE
ncbi:MAG: DNA topoisomerase IV subunit A [Acidobacteria bacterium]|nr:DNA topoisomerase IV subunit A [Acidobacteriota bacterium]